MKKIFTIFLLLSTISLFAQNKELNIRPNRAYMNFVVKGYLSWYKDRFLVDPLLHSKKDYLNKVLSRVDSWQIPDKSYPMSQILFGQGVNNKGDITYRFRLYVHPEVREKNEWFVEWSSGSEICFLSPLDEGDIRLNRLKIMDNIGKKYFKYDCKQKNGFIGVQYLAETIENVPYLDTIAGISYKVFEPHGLVETYLESKQLLLHKLPQEIHPYAFVHMLHLMKPLQKISFESNQSVMIYYP